MIDCDLRNPTLSGKLAPTANCGIVDVIAGKTALVDAVWKDQSTHLEFLPAATKTPLTNSSEILAAEATKEFFENVQSKYDYVLVDLPPLTPIVDTRATTGIVDSYFCVIEWGHTNINAVKHALKEAANVYEKLIGVVLNKADIDRLSSYQPVGKNYYRSKYFAQYGFTE